MVSVRSYIALANRKHPNPGSKRSNAPKFDVRAGLDTILNVPNAFCIRGHVVDNMRDNLVAARNTPPAAHY